MAPTLRSLEARIAALEGATTHAVVASPNPLPGAVPESFMVDVNGRPIAETGRMIGLPGITVFAPPTAQLVVQFSKGGQDPVILGGTGTPVAIKAVQALATTYGATTGGVIVADPVTGVSAIVVTPLGIHAIGPAGMVNVPAITAAFTAYTGAMNGALTALATAIGGLSDPPTASGIAGAISTFAGTMTTATATLLAALVV